MADYMPPLKTDRGVLRFFSINETRIGSNGDGVPVVDSRRLSYAVDEGGSPRPARAGEVTEFLDLLMRGPGQTVPSRDEPHT
jgi:hypothetical protein